MREDSLQLGYKVGREPGSQTEPLTGGREKARDKARPGNRATVAGEEHTPGSNLERLVELSFGQEARGATDSKEEAK